MFSGFWNISIFNVLKILCKNKAKSSYALNFYEFSGLLFFKMFLKIHTRNRGHIWSNKESFWGALSKISLRINLYCYFWEFKSYFRLFSAVFGPKIHDFLPHFARFKPDFHVPREILSYRKKNHVNRNNITVATAASVLQLLQVQIGGSNSLIIHQPQSSCMRNDQVFVTVRWLCMNTSIWVNTSPKSLGNHLYWH